MKQSFLPILTGFIAALCSLTSMAQQSSTAKKIPAWISTQGYWVLENNKNCPNDSKVYFYNNDHVLVYKEQIINRRIKLNKKKTLLRLKAALDEAIISYEQGTSTDKQFLLAKHLDQ